MSELSHLSSPSWRERKRAIQSLAQSGDPALLPTLMEILRAGHADLGALNAALQIISELGEQVTPALLKLLADPDPETRLYAALALSSLCDERSIPALMDALTDENPNVRFQAVDALANLKAEAAIPPLMKLAQGADFYLAFAAVTALGEIGSPQVLPDLLPLLNNDILAPAAAQALGKLGDRRALEPLARWLHSPTGDPAGAARAFANFFEAVSESAAGAQVIEALGVTGLARLLEVLPPRSNPVQQVSNEDPAADRSEMDLAQALARILSSLLPVVEGGGSDHIAAQDILLHGLFRLLRHSPARPLAMAALGKAAPFPLAELKPLLEDDDPVARRAAAALLAQRAQPADLALLLSALQGEDEETAALAAGGLGHIKALVSFPHLLDALTHGGPQLRLASLEAMVRLEHADFNKAMIDLLASPEAELRQAALHGVRLQLEMDDTAGRDPEPAFVAAIMEACSDPAPAVRRLAVEALGYGRGPQIEAALASEAASGDPGRRAAAARALAHAAPALSLPLLETLLQDADPRVRIPAVRSFARQADVGSLDLLARLAADPAPPVRMALAQAVAVLASRDDRAQRILETLEQDADPDVRVEAAGARAPSDLTGAHRGTDLAQRDE